MNEIEIYNNSVKVTEIQLDKAIQNFLERRDYETYDVQKVDVEKKILFNTS